MALPVFSTLFKAVLFAGGFVVVFVVLNAFVLSFLPFVPRWTTVNCIVADIPSCPKENQAIPEGSWISRGSVLSSDHFYFRPQHYHHCACLQVEAPESEFDFNELDPAIYTPYIETPPPSPKNASNNATAPIIPETLKTGTIFLSVCFQNTLETVSTNDLLRLCYRPKGTAGNAKTLVGNHIAAVPMAGLSIGFIPAALEKVHFYAALVLLPFYTLAFAVFCKNYIDPCLEDSTTK